MARFSVPGAENGRLDWATVATTAWLLDLQ